MHEQLLAQAAVGAPTSILGLALRPYSLGHELWLIRQNNPLVAGGQVSRASLFEAILICCEDWQGASAMNTDWLMPLKLWIWRKRTRKQITALAVEEFRHYRAMGSLCFKVNGAQSGQKTPRPPGAPFLLRLHMFLMEQFHYTEAQAWDHPFGLAMMKWCAHWENKEALEIYNEVDSKTDEFQAANDARLKAFIDAGMSDEDAWSQLIKEGLTCQA